MKTNKTSHYYGDTVRVLFITIGVIILFGMPIVASSLGIPAISALLFVLILGVAAGLTNPLQEASMVFNVGVSFFGLLLFSYVSWGMYQNMLIGPILIINQIIAIAFLLSLYLSIKTYRGFHLKDRAMPRETQH